MIKLATIEDKDELLALANDHIEHVGRLTMGGVDDDCVNRLCDYTLTQDDSACFCYVKDGKIVGFIAGTIGSPTLNSQQFFIEHLFVFKPGYGAYSIPVIKAVKQFVKDAELDGLIMGCMKDAGERVFKLYNKLGLNELERKYIWTPTE